MRVFCKMSAHFFSIRSCRKSPRSPFLKRGAEGGFMTGGLPGRAVNHAIQTALVLLFTLLPYAALAYDGRSYLEVGGGYKTGDFGTPVRSNLFYFSPILGYVAPRYEVSVTVPYLFLSNSGGGITNSESGIGDIILRGSRVLMPEGKSGFSLDGTLAIKIPTADETKGLGTGEADYGAFLGAHQRVDKFKLSLSFGYIKVGDPPSINFNDIYLYGIGISRIFGTTELFSSFEGRRAIIPGAKNPQEINVGLFHVLNRDWAVKGGTFAGLNKGGPDFGLNFGL